MITVVTFNRSGARLDTAEAATPEDALVAARTMIEDARLGIQGERFTASFYVDGVLSRTATEQEVPR